MDDWAELQAVPDLDPSQLAVIEAIFAPFKREGRWPSFHEVDVHLDRTHGIVDCTEVIRGLPSGIVVQPRLRITYWTADDEMRLWTPGIARCADGARELRTFAVTLRVLAEIERTSDVSDGPAQASEAELLAAVQTQLADTTALDLKKVRTLLAQEPPDSVWSQSGGTDGHWTITLTRGIRRYRGISDWNDYLAVARAVPGAFGNPERRSLPEGSQPWSSAPLGEIPEEWDVALSFASEDGDFVRGVAHALRDARIQVFFAEFEAVELWGRDLIEEFEQIYGKRSRYMVAFISRHYVDKPWTRHEHRSGQGRQLTEDRPYFLPVRLDDSELPGLLSTVAYIDARSLDPSRVAALILQKLNQAPAAHAARPVGAPPEWWIPTSHDDRVRHAATNVDAWEYVTFAGALQEGLAAAEPSWRDYEMRHAPPAETLRTTSEVAGHLQRATEDLLSLVDTVNQVITPAVQQRAFGESGEPGDLAWIEHWAERIIDIYRGLLGWEARTRAVRVPAHCREAVDATAALADSILIETRAFLKDAIQRLGTLPQFLSRLPDDKAMHMTLTLAPSVDPAAMKRHNKAVRKMQRLG